MKIVRAGTLIDGTGAPPVRDAVIQIDNGRIVRAYEEWLDEVERELEPTKPRSRGGSAPPTA